MTPSIAITPTQPQASQALLRERLAELEATLLEARGRVMLSFDRELASIRGWMESLQNYDPTIGLQALNDPGSATLDEREEEFLGDSPHAAIATNIVPFSSFAFGDDSDIVLEEQPLDPALASATLDELNAALAAAFEQMAHPLPASEPRSA